MQSVCEALNGSIFMVLFLIGSAAVTLLGGFALFKAPKAEKHWPILGAAVFLLGVVAPEFVITGSMNNELLEINLAHQNLDTEWVTFLDGWARWNHLKMASSFVATLCFGLAAMRSIHDAPAT